MRVQAIGVKRMSGVGKESKKAFDFSRLSILRPIEVVAKEGFQLAGYGFEVSDLDLANEALPQFAPRTSNWSLIPCRAVKVFGRS